MKALHCELFFTASSSYREGDVRLEGGPHNWEGRVEIYSTGTWTTISDPDWTDEDALVVCRQLYHSIYNSMMLNPISTLITLLLTTLHEIFAILPMKNTTETLKPTFTLYMYSLFLRFCYSLLWFIWHWEFGFFLIFISEKVSWI